MRPRLRRLGQRAGAEQRGGIHSFLRSFPLSSPSPLSRSTALIMHAEQKAHELEGSRIQRWVLQSKPKVRGGDGQADEKPAAASRRLPEPEPPAGVARVSCRCCCCAAWETVSEKRCAHGLMRRAPEPELLMIGSVGAVSLTDRRASSLLLLSAGRAERRATLARTTSRWSRCSRQTRAQQQEGWKEQR
jgi:hypothetical protein